MLCSSKEFLFNIIRQVSICIFKLSQFLISLSSRFMNQNKNFNMILFSFKLKTYNIVRMASCMRVHIKKHWKHQIIGETSLFVSHVAEKPRTKACGFAESTLWSLMFPLLMDESLLRPLNQEGKHHVKCLRAARHYSPHSVWLTGNLGAEREVTKDKWRKH